MKSDQTYEQVVESLQYRSSILLLTRTADHVNLRSYIKDGRRQKAFAKRLVEDGYVKRCEPQTHLYELRCDMLVGALPATTYEETLKRMAYTYHRAGLGRLVPAAVRWTSLEVQDRVWACTSPKAQLIVASLNLAIATKHEEELYEPGATDCDNLDRIYVRTPELTARVESYWREKRVVAAMGKNLGAALFDAEILSLSDAHYLGSSGKGFFDSKNCGLGESPDYWHEETVAELNVKAQEEVDAANRRLSLLIRLQDGMKKVGGWEKFKAEWMEKLNKEEEAKDGATKQGE